MEIPNRERALKVLYKYVKSESLIRHAFTVEAVMYHFSDIYEENNKEKWRIIGLLHDIDFEIYPDEHLKHVRDLLDSEIWPEEYLRAIESHGYKLVNDIEPVENMEKVLYATDELTGLIYATAILRPSKSLDDLTVKSVKKKWKQKGFAVGVDRSVIEEGAKLLNLELDYLIQETINGMKKIDLMN